MNLAQKIYTILLKLYPRTFRRRFEGEMLSLWLELYREYREGNDSTFVFWSSSIYDVVINAVKQQIKEKSMNLIHHQITRIPIEAVYLLLGLGVTGLVCVPLLLQLYTLAETSVGTTLALIFTTLLVTSFFVPALLNLRFLLGKDEPMKQKVKRSMLIYAIAVCCTFALLFILQGPFFEIAGLIITLSVVFLMRPWWSGTWLSVGALTLCGLFFSAAITLYSTTNLNTLLVNDAVIQRAEFAICERLWPEGADSDDQCNVTVDAAGNTYNRTYLPLP